VKGGCVLDLVLWSVPAVGLGGLVSGLKGRFHGGKGGPFKTMVFSVGLGGERCEGFLEGCGQVIVWGPPRL